MAPKIVRDAAISVGLFFVALGSSIVVHNGKLVMDSFRLKPRGVIIDNNGVKTHFLVQEPKTKSAHSTNSYNIANSNNNTATTTTTINNTVARPQARSQRPTVVIIPDTGETTEAFAPLMDSLSADECRVATYDRPGFGFSDAPKYRNDRDVDTLTTELHSLLNHAQESGPFLLVGHATGALIAKEFHRRYPNKVSGLLLVEPHDYSELSNAYWRIQGDKALLHTNLTGYLNYLGFFRFYTLFPLWLIPTTCVCALHALQCMHVLQALRDGGVFKYRKERIAYKYHWCRPRTWRSYYDESVHLFAPPFRSWQQQLSSSSSSSDYVTTVVRATEYPQYENRWRRSVHPSYATNTVLAKGCNPFNVMYAPEVQAQIKALISKSEE